MLHVTIRIEMKTASPHVQMEYLLSKNVDTHNHKILTKFTYFLIEVGVSPSPDDFRYYHMTIRQFIKYEIYQRFHTLPDMTDRL